jgi:hypothetical protein
MVTFNPSVNIVFANCLASISVGNALVCRREGARDDLARHLLGASTVTYQWLVCLAMTPARVPTTDHHLILIKLRMIGGCIFDQWRIGKA